MTLRRSDASDIDSIVQVWLAATRQAHPFIPYERWLEHVDDMRTQYVPNSETFVCEADGRVLGFVSLVDDYLAALFVDPSAQGRGVGTALLGFAKSLRESLTLAVYAENEAAVGFYRRGGFEVAEERVDERTGHPEFVMIWSSVRAAKAAANGTE